MINFHPSDRLLENYASAELSSGLALAVATHLDYCPICRQHVEQIEAELAQAHLLDQDSMSELLLAQADNTAEPDSLAGMGNMLDQILQTDISVDEAEQTKAVTQHHLLEVNQQKYSLPRTLKSFYQPDVRWRKLSGVHTNKLGEYDDFRANLLYIEAETHVPKHTHKSLEITVVLAGSLCDEQGQYYPGDFIVLDNSMTHSPATQSEQACLCLTVMDAPVQFTEGAARLLNPFTQLMY